AFQQVCKLLENPHLKSLFSDNSRAEVSLTGTLKIHGKEQIISGQIDRLCVTQDSVLFADFKTGILPEDETTIAPNYLLQMALYRKLLQTIYPDKNIDAFLIYCKEAKIFTLTPEKLDACLNEFT
ncbi:PD-(D/E)XK nuclease family protein, partial [Bartonella taylorii]|uniref:PD-(D/E)XK nuclease family protein n=2 Tax=Bartonellaceae TaxID=772 RepID=UPI001ABA2FB0